MDTERCSFEDYRACLRDLERVNVLTLAYRPTLAFLDRLAASNRLPRDRPVTIVDVGAGNGDMLRRIGAWAERRQIPVDVIGIDRNPQAARAAQQAAAPEARIRYVTADVFGYRADGPVDLVISSLFTHHLDDGAVRRFVAWMEETAEIGWFVNDLHRHWLPYAVFKAWSRVAGWHRFVRHDGPVSIARAFTGEDWRRLIESANIPAGGCSVTWHMPFRLCVARVRPTNDGSNACDTMRSS